MVLARLKRERERVQFVETTDPEGEGGREGGREREGSKVYIPPSLTLREGAHTALWGDWHEGSVQSLLPLDANVQSNSHVLKLTRGHVAHVS